MNSLDNGYIDSHVHLWTSDQERFPRAPEFTLEPVEPSSFTADELFQWTRPVGVERIVLVQMSLYGFDHTFILDVMQHHQGVFSGVALVDPDGGDPVGEMRHLKALGIRGVRIVPPKRCASCWLDSPGMQAMWQCGAEEQIAICPLIDVEDLAAVDRACSRFSKTTVVIDHCARIGGDGEFRDGDLRQLCELARHERICVKLSAFYHLGAKRPPYTDLVPIIGRLVQAYGPERLMWGTDSPFQNSPPNTYRGALQFLRDRCDGFTARDKYWLLRGTAERVFFG
jgi:predicted TIM-barrel fold metal-dependent hydrolase